MHEIKEFLLKNNIKPLKYKKENNVYIINNKYVLKKNRLNNQILNLLKSRGFNMIPNIIAQDEKYLLTEFITDKSIPLNDRIQDLIDTISILHLKTTHYEEISPSEIENLYTDLNNNILHLESYYNDIMISVESHVFMSPWEYNLARNISIINYSLEEARYYLEKWHQEVSNNKIRKTVIHGNLKLDHFLKNDQSYLISWDKSRIDIPIFDLYKLYNNTYKYISLDNLINRYEIKYKLEKQELYLLKTLLLIPDKILFDKDTYENTKEITRMIYKLKKTNDYIQSYKAKTNSQ